MMHVFRCCTEKKNLNSIFILFVDFVSVCTFKIAFVVSKDS